MQLRELAQFLQAFERPDFKAGEWVKSTEESPGLWSMPYVHYNDTTDAFVQAAYDDGWVQPSFDWGEWMQSDEAKLVLDSYAAIAAASPEQLARMLTVVIRRDRFVEGGLLGAFESGLILRIVRRAAALLSTGEGP